MLERVALAGERFDWNDDARLLGGLAYVTTNAVRSLGDRPALLRPGDSADCTLVPAGSVAEASVAQPTGRIVFVYRRRHIVAGAALARPAASRAHARVMASLVV